MCRPPHQFPPQLRKTITHNDTTHCLHSTENQPKFKLGSPDLNGTRSVPTTFTNGTRSVPTTLTNGTRNVPAIFNNRTLA